MHWPRFLWNRFRMVYDMFIDKLLTCGRGGDLEYTPDLLPAFVLSSCHFLAFHFIQIEAIRFSRPFHTSDQNQVPRDKLFDRWLGCTHSCGTIYLFQQIFFFFLWPAFRFFSVPFSKRRQRSDCGSKRAWYHRFCAAWYRILYAGSQPIAYFDSIIV
jgi:hypothetical protein